MKTKLLTIAMTAALMLTAMTKVQAQNFDGPCLPPSHGLDGHQSAFCGAMQVIALASGWNWVSFNVEITLADLEAAIDAVAETGDRPVIKSQSNGQVQKNAAGTSWNGRLRALDLSQMYKIQIGADCEITVAGMPINPAELPITIKSGANWIAFPLSESMTVINAFSNFNAMTGDIVKGLGGGQATKTASSWAGRLRTLEPGKGYIYNSKATENKTLVFPMPAK